MRILIATNSYPTNKNPTHQVFVRNIYNGLKKKFPQTDLVYNRYYEWFKSDLGKGNAITGLFKFVALIWSYLPYFIYKTKKYDVIYSHGELLPGILIPTLQKIFGVKHICYVHGSANIFTLEKGFNFMVTKYVFNKSDLLVTNSVFMQSVIKKEYGLPSTIVTPGYNTDLFNTIHQTRTIDICFAGSAVHIKGADLILKAVNINRIFYQKHGLKIHIYTDGALKADYLNYIESNNLTDFISIYERLSDQDLSKTFKKTKVVLFPSREESLGLIGIEAIASGCVLIAANTGGITEYVDHGKNGFLFERENAEDLQKMIEYVFKNYNAIRTEFADIQKSVQAYSLEKGIHQTVELFSSIFAGKDL